MQYPNVVAATFRNRPNRFVAEAKIGEQSVICHVKNTGRCRELLIPGATVYLQDFGETMRARKTRYDLIAVEKRTGRGTLLINMDAQAPNKVFGEWARAGGFRRELTLLRPETAWGSSRFDFYWEGNDGRKGFVEVKGVTLEENGVARFPDAPTQRGVKHLKELIRARREGYEASVCFVIQMADAVLFCPNDGTHRVFGDALREAAAAGVEVLARSCAVTPDTLTMGDEVAISLKMQE